MQKRQFLTAVACATLALSAGSAMAQDKFKIGLILPPLYELIGCCPFSDSR